MSSIVSIQTTQNVSLEFLPASMGDRMLAFAIDAIIMTSWLVLGSLLVSGYLPQLTDNQSLIITAYLLLIGFPVMFYSLLSEVFMNGQSLGKRVMQLRVVRVDGKPVRLGDYLIRWLLRMVDIWIFSGLIGLLTMALYNGQRLGDRAAKTIVVKLRPPVRLNELVPAHEEEPQYALTFPEAIALSDRDTNTIRRVMKKTQQHQTFDLLALTATRVKEVTGIQTDLDDWNFLVTILKDHTYLLTREEE